MQCGKKTQFKNTRRHSNSNEQHQMCTAFQALAEEKKGKLSKTIQVNEADITTNALINTGATYFIMCYDFLTRIKVKYNCEQMNNTGVEYVSVKKG